MNRLLTGAVVIVCGTFAAEVAKAQCPTVGNDTGCGTVITVTQTGATVSQTGMGPYDGSDDTLVGVVNNIPACVAGQNSQSACGISIYSLDLASTNDIFGFDGDGIVSYGVAGNAMDTTGYGGPNAYFSNIVGNKGRVNFITPIPPGGTGYFSLENALNTPTACTNLLNNSLHGATGGGFTPPPVGNGPNTAAPTGAAGQNLAIRATFVPTPANGTTYTRTQAAQLCGFVDFDWQQTITSWPAPSNLVSSCNPTPLVAPPPFNDPPSCGYAYMPQPFSNPTPTYYNPYSSSGGFALPTYETASQLSFYDSPNDPLLPAGGSLNFTTHLVGLLGPGPTYSAVDTGIGFTWTSNHAGAAGGTAVTITDPTGTIDTSGTGGTSLLSVSQTSSYTGVSVAAVNASQNIFAPSPLLIAILPASRSAQPNGTVTAFATIINTGTSALSGCSIGPASGIPATFVYQTTNPATNAVTGTANTPVTIPGNNGSQSFVIAFTPTMTLPPTSVGFNVSCANSTPAPINNGLNTLLLSASTTTPTPDLVALGATINNDGIVHVTGTPGASSFAVASDNLGASDMITVGTNTGAATLPVAIAICQTNPTTGQCLATPAATVTTMIASRATPTFGVFVTSSNSVAFDPANSRVFVTFTDSTGAVRGETSVAVETQ